jgi:uncharacterized protein involved in response to NO
MRIQLPAAARALAATLGDEALRLFFPLAALHAALWPLLWVVLHRLDLPLARDVPPSLWHAHEMVIGGFGAALLGFILTAAPEWTGQERPRGRALFVLAGLWGVGRLVGLLGADALGLAGAVADLAWLGGIVGFLALASWRARTLDLRGFLFWVAALWVCEAGARIGFLTGDPAFAGRMLRLAILVFTALLGLALARVTPVITNRVLDPSGTRTPFRPHPGRRNLAPITIAIAIAGDLAGASPAVNGFFLIAAGAAFLDRAGEAFVGRAALRGEILALGGSAALAGAGLSLTGLARLDLPVPELAGLHLLTMGGLGLGVLAVFSIAGRLHTGRALEPDTTIKAAVALLLAAAAVRTLTAFGIPGEVGVGVGHVVASLAWAGAFLLWLRRYWPWLSETRG